VELIGYVRKEAIMNSTFPMNVIRSKQVQAKTGLARSTMYLKIQLGSFPKPIKLGVRASGWVESEIDQWIFQKFLESREIDNNSLTQQNSKGLK
jgi:prophage regulatory protein